MDNMDNLMDEILNGADKVLKVPKDKPDLDAGIIQDAIRMKMVEIRLRGMLVSLLTNVNEFLAETEDVYDFTKGVIFGQIKTMVDIFSVIDPEVAEIIKEALKRNELGSIIFGDNEEEGGSGWDY